MSLCWTKPHKRLPLPHSLCHPSSFRKQAWRGTGGCTKQLNHYVSCPNNWTGCTKIIMPFLTWQLVCMQCNSPKPDINEKKFVPAASNYHLLCICSDRTCWRSFILGWPTHVVIKAIQNIRERKFICHCLMMFSRLMLLLNEVCYDGSIWAGDSNLKEIRSLAGQDGPVKTTPQYLGCQLFWRPSRFFERKIFFLRYLFWLFIHNITQEEQGFITRLCFYLLTSKTNTVNIMLRSFIFFCWDEDCSTNSIEI